MGIIPNIKIKITGTEVNQVVEALSEIETNPVSTTHKVAVSVLEKVMEKLLKKQIAKRHDINPFKLELEFFEVFFLKEYLLRYNVIMEKHYIQTLINKLDQKLA